MTYVCVFSTGRNFMKLLGIDNVFFEVGDIEQAIDFYESLGFELKFKIPHLSGALFKVGNEEPGLVLQQSSAPKPSCLWVEVSSAHEVQDELASLNISGTIIEPPTGFTFQIADPWGNRIGFADYTKKSELARK